MSIIRERIKINNADVNLKINLGDIGNSSGYQQEINTITRKTKNELVNPIIDNEVRKFKYSPNGTLTLSFFFQKTNKSYESSFLNNDLNFNVDDINQQNTKITNSFFIMDYYDTYDNNTQTKISTNYLTKVLGGLRSQNVQTPKYELKTPAPNQFNYIYIPESYIKTQTTTKVTGYIRFSFYNAKSGRLFLMYNKQNEYLKTPERMYFKVTLDFNTMTWIFNSTSYNTQTMGFSVHAYQIPINSEYSKKINNNIDNINNKKQEFPTGNTFQYSDGLYTTL